MTLDVSECVLGLSRIYYGVKAVPDSADAVYSGMTIDNNILVYSDSNLRSLLLASTAHFIEATVRYGKYFIALNKLFSNKEKV